MVLVVSTVERHALEKLLRDVRITGRRGKSREPVQTGEEAVLHAAGLDLAWPADDARDAEAALEHGAFGGAERRHAAVRPSEDLRAVVGGEDDYGVVGNADIVEVFEQGTDVVVELRHA